MKFKSLFITSLCGLAIAATGCSDDDDYTPAPAAPAPEAYFSLADVPEITVGEGENQFDVTVYRSEAGTELTVPVTCSIAESANLFTVPSSVTFADGSTETQLSVTYDTNDLTGNIDYLFTFSVGDGENDAYFLQTVTYTLRYEPWVRVVGDNGEQYCKYTEDIFSGAYTVENVTYELELQTSPTISGLYRLVNPYGEAYPYNEPGDYSTEPHYMYFNCQDPDYVFLCDSKGNATKGTGSGDFTDAFVFETGVTWNQTYGEFLITGFANIRLASGNTEAAANFVGTLKNGVITFPKNAFFFTYADAWSEGSGWYGNKNGAFKIVFPGVVEEEDPNDVWNTLGEGVYTDPFILPLYGLDPTQYPYNVEVQQYAGDPNRYRIVNPYKTGVFPIDNDYDGDIYIEFDCTNQEMVLMGDFQNCGWVDEDDGDTRVITAADFYLSYQTGYTEEDIIAAELNIPFDGSTISFNPGTTMANFPNSTNKDSQDRPISNLIYNCNASYNCSLTLPAAAAASSAYTVGGSAILNNKLMLGNRLKNATKMTRNDGLNIIKKRLSR